MRNLKRWQRTLIIAFALLIVIPIVGFIVLGLMPVPSDTVLPDDQIIVGAQGKPGAVGGIDTNFPKVNALDATDAQRDLGKMLFFDPILSQNHAMACASCHQPPNGLSDGRAVGEGINGVALKRNVPSLYEVAYKSSLMWDGRADTLEAQITIPMTSADEMANTPEQIVKDLQGVDAYKELFAKAFPDAKEAITFENVGMSLAAFERSLLAHNSPFDKYAAGDFSALTPSQRRGFALFRSGATSCYKCHMAPTFTNGKYEVTGVPDANGNMTDEGRGGITKVATEQYAFIVPSLRNVALTAPYMHNGRFATLDEVLDFYIKGGGEGMKIDVPTQSRFVHAFEVSAQEKQDMVNFLYALTDESATPTTPSSVPSGLTVPTHDLSPAFETAKQINAGGVAVTQRAPMTLTVTPDVTIQSVVDTAIAGDTIEIQYGTYNERVLIDQDNITVRGIPNDKGEYPILDGKMQFSDGISASGNNFLIEKLAVKNYKGNGIIIDGVTGVIVRDIYVENTSLYGIYPVHSTDVLVERVEATKIRDAGVYAGQCRKVVLRNNKVYGNVIGIEIENSIDSDLYDNHAYENSTGIFVDLLPQLPSKVSLQTRVHENVIENNNFTNFANAGEIGQLVPEGTGILILGGDDVEIYNNTIRENRTVGVAIFSTATAFKPELIDIGPNPERIHIHDNTYTHNGYDAAKQLTDLGLTGKDVIWDVSNWDMRIDEPNATSFPPILPASSWPDLSRKAYWQIVHFIVTKLG
ncbi:MAG: right-handed parallel beta-helix repeat-containing protein [Anaerolineae bacterium]|nr:right-handed parallel beta-helix repeat-containing protein [Anaerolineae bacterium]